MAQLIEGPTRITAAGRGEKTIDEYVGRVNTAETRLSVAYMKAPGEWSEPWQQPEFDEYTVVLKGSLHVQTEDGPIEVAAGQAVLAEAGDWVRYSTGKDGAEYMAICTPAFSPQEVHREEDA